MARNPTITRKTRSGTGRAAEAHTSNLYVRCTYHVYIEFRDFPESEYYVVHVRGGMCLNSQSYDIYLHFGYSRVLRLHIMDQASA